MLTDTPPVPRASRQHLVEFGLAAVAVFALAIPVATSLDTPSRAMITVDNPHEWNIGVELELDDGTRLPVATIGSGENRTITEILHPGDTWRLHWKFVGRDVAETTVTDADLRAAEHRLRVPDEVAQRLMVDDQPATP